ncbi:MAG: 1-acyl-sn-glycerol-3-phosphate acyltransferase [Bacteroidetes bacterium]|nr:1-acyl-sn-glycerol-3-phosphate acyltransferase [Bacteroidota bacterium]
MSIKNIERWSFRYSFLKKWITFWQNNVFYKKILVLNKENIPENEHLIFAPNHQNALMDALAVGTNLKGQPAFLARSDIFNKPFIANLLYMFKMLPVYRIRDGIDTIGNNQSTFEKTIDVINNKNGLIILPEGNHSKFRRLQVLKKGICRIAFQTEESRNFSLNLKIIPVGLDYSNHQQIRSTLIIKFGKPIEVRKFKELYLENPQKGMRALKEEISERIKELMLHIETSSYYDLYNRIRLIYGSKMAKNQGINEYEQPSALEVDQKTVNVLNKYHDKFGNRLDNLKEKVEQFTQLSTKLNIDHQVLENGPSSFINLLLKSLAALLFLPVFIYGFINNFLPFYIPERLSGVFNDKQFHSSVKFVLSMILFPLFYLIQTLLVSFLPLSGFYTAGYFLSLPVSAAFAFYYSNSVKKLKTGWRFVLLRAKKDQQLLSLSNIHNSIITEMDKIFSWFRKQEAGTPA